ncbi:MAG TPA: TRAP transporter permease [Desulfobacteraceae bacterium]|nr:TRAP transporter permease [Desulfobacteraceae bacterium]
MSQTVQNSPKDDPNQSVHSTAKAVEAIVDKAESGGRKPDSRFAQVAIPILCMAWSFYQIGIAYKPIDSHVARAWHLAFALFLAFLLFPSHDQHNPPFWVRWFKYIFPFIGKYSIVRRIPVLDILLAAAAACAALFIWWDFDKLVWRQGIPSTSDIILGSILIVLLLEGARRSLGPALAILATLFLLYTIVGPHLPEILRHRGVPLDFIISDMYLTTTGIFGVPLGVSTDFVFLFVLFGALLDKAGGGKYFIDIAFSALGTFRGGPAKASVMASGLTGLVSGSSIANTVTTGTFTIPLMKKVGLPGYKAAAVEVAASTNGQLMPPIMGAAAFIMAEILGIPYLDVVRAALLPALISYFALFYVVHIEALKLGLKALNRDELPPFFRTFIRGSHFLIPLGVLIVYLVIMRRSPITSALLAIESLVVIMLIQRPVIVFLKAGVDGKAGTLDPSFNLKKSLLKAFLAGFDEVKNGLIQGARNMVSVGVATATAGIIVGVVTITGLVGRFIILVDTISMGNVILMLIFTAMTSLLLGMGMPTTANYIIMATLTAPVIIQLGSDAGLVFPLIAAHLFVFYFGILADDTPPVGLAAYAGAAIARSDPIKTGIQGFTYDLRTAILPFIFLFNTELLMIKGVTEAGNPIWINDPIIIGWTFFSGLIAMFAFASFLMGHLVTRLNLAERLLLVAVAASTFKASTIEAYVPLGPTTIKALGVSVYFGLFIFQKVRVKRRKTQKQRTES